LADRFVNRVDELATLQRWWDQRSAGLAMVWGRRRVGKTAVLQEFSKERPAIFHTGAGRPVADELAILSRAAAPVAGTGLRDLSARPFQDWDDVLESLAALAEDEPLLVVLDEFPELVKVSPELPGVLRAFWDRVRTRSKLRLLVCGSAVRSMEAMRQERAPLYGRLDLALLIHPFKPHEAALMLPQMRPEDQAVVYGLLGGVPLYLSWWDQHEPIITNVGRLLARPGAPLLSEGQLILATEAEAGDLPGQVLRAIATGRTKYNEIKDAVRAEPHRTLERLQELRLVERILPVGEVPDRSRRRLYRLADNFLAFWLGVVERYRAEIERGLGESILPVMLESLDDHMGPAWEEMFREHLRRLATAGRLGRRVVAVGRWWQDSGAELDAVVLQGREQAPILAGEAKWAKVVDGQRILDELRRSAAAMVGADRLGDLRFAIGARERVTHVPAGALPITASDVFSQAL
jgi:uncharacterized protein